LTSPDRIVVINDLSQPLGGASALAVQSAVGLARRGLPITFLAGDRPAADGLGHPGVAVSGLGQARLLARGRGDALVNGWWNQAAWHMVRRWITAHDTPRTVYHLHGWSQILSPAVLHALGPVHDRLVLSAHDFFLVCPNGALADFSGGTPCTRIPLGLSCCLARCDRRGRADKAWRIGRAVIQRVVMPLGQCPPVLAIHAAMCAGLARGGIPAEAIKVLPNPAVAWSATRIAAETNREVLFVGRIEDTKGPDLALLAARAGGVPIRLIGDGALAASLRTAHPEAQFSGRLNHGEVAALAQRARVLVMPSRYPEPFGLVAIEALASGIPVIMAPTALLADDIVRIGAGIACDPRDTAGFSALLNRLASDDHTIAAMSRAAFAHGGALALTPESWLDALLAAYADRL